MEERSEEGSVAVADRPARRIRLVGDADAVEWVAAQLSPDDVEPDSGTAESLAPPPGPIVWVARPCPVDDAQRRVDAAVWSFPCLVVVRPGEEIPDVTVGHPSVESFDILREPEDAPVVRMRLERLLLLHRRRSQTEVLLDNLPDIIYTRTWDGVVTSVNAACERLLGLKPEQVIGRLVPEVVGNAEEIAASIARTNEDLLARGRSRHRMAADLPDGRRSVFDVEAFLLHDGRDRPSGVQVVLSDVTEETAANARLQLAAERNEVLAAIATAARDAVEVPVILATVTRLLTERLAASASEVWLLDDARAVFHLAHAYVAMTGAPDPSGATRTLAESVSFRTIVETSRPYVVLDCETLDPSTWSYQFARKFGIRTWVGVPVLYKGEIIGIVGISFRRIRPFSEDELLFLQRVADQVAIAVRAARLYDDLQQKVTALEEAQRTREEAERDRRQLSSMLVHDLKNPLSAVTASLEIALERTHEDERLRRILRNSLASATKLQGLIEDALLVYRPDDGAVLPKSPVSLSDVLALPLEEARWLAEARQLALNVRVAPDLPRIPLDASRFRRAVANLITNAVKFSPRGSEIDISAVLDERDGRRWLVLLVSDRGPGVPDGERDLLATPYRRLSGSEKVAGTGLGLTVVRRVAEAHQGLLEVKPRADGPGSTFSLWIPA